jgi:hypothetical protein
MKFVEIIYKNLVRTSQETHHVSATKPNLLMLFRETVAVYCENQTEHTYKLRVKCKVLDVKAGGKCSNHF